MLALLLIPILVSGYIMVIANPYHYFRLHRHDGQLLYLKVATYGTFCLIASTIIAGLIKWKFPDFHPVKVLVTQFKVTGNEDSDRIYIWLTLLSFTSIVFALFYVFITWIKNTYKGCRYKRKHGALYTKVRQAKNARILKQTLSSGTMDALLFDALESEPKRSVLINLSSKKVYVGLVNGLSDPNEKEGPNKFISIFPIMSGYRNKDTLLVEFTNIYPSTKTVRSAPTVRTKKTVTNKLDIILSTDEITHISWFDFELFETINDSINGSGPKHKRNSKVRSSLRLR